MFTNRLKVFLEPGCILPDHGQIYDQFTTNLQPIYASIYDLFCARAMRGCQLTPTRERPILIDSESTEHHSGNTLTTEIINVRASTTVAQKHCITIIMNKSKSSTA